MIKKILLVIFFVFGLFYLVAPGPKSINDFNPLPNSTKSDLPGDTVQNPNIAAYFSEFNRSFITKYYFQNLRNDTLFGKFIPPIRLNHPPEEAFQYIRDQQVSTFLEEYVYPFRESIYVNGYEPYIQNGIASDKNLSEVEYQGNFYPSKTTIRFYKSNPLYRVIIYILSWLAFITLIWIFKKVRSER